MMHAADVGKLIIFYIIKNNMIIWKDGWEGVHASCIHASMHALLTD
jgi:hypothetical protein